MAFSFTGNGKIGSGLLLGGLAGGLFGGGKDDSAVNFPPPPSYVTNPNYQSEQDFLQPYGMGLLSGNNIPDFYKSIATSNSPEFQNVLANSNRDISQSAAESAAKTGRGGNLSAITAQAIGDNSSKLRYADFLSSNQGKQFLMNQGTGISEGVRAAGQQEGANQNNFNMNTYNDLVNQLTYNTNRQDTAAAASGKMLGTIAGGIGGFFLGGPAGAAVGANLGSSLTGGGQGPSTSSIDSLFTPSVAAPASNNNTASSAAGVSNLGAINTSGTQVSDMLKKYFNLN